MKGEREAEYVGKELFEKKKKSYAQKIKKQRENLLHSLLNNFAIIVEQNVKNSGNKSDELRKKTLTIINKLIQENFLKDRGTLTQEPSQVLFYKNSGENNFSVAWDELISIDFGDKKMNERVLNILSHCGGKQVICEALGFEKAWKGLKNFGPDKIFTLGEFQDKFGRKKLPPKAIWV